MGYGKFQLHVASLNLWRRLSPVEIFIGQVVRGPRIESTLGTRGLIGLELLNIILMALNMLQYYLEVHYVEYIGLFSTLLVIFYLTMIATRRVEMEGIKWLSMK